MRISDQVAAMVEKAIAQHAPDEGVSYDVGVMLMPTGPSRCCT